MRFDKETQLSADQAFTASAVSTNAYDTKEALADISIGSRMAIGVYPKVAGAGGASWKLDAIQADNAALTTNVEVIGTVTVADADLKVGKEIEVPIVQGKKTRRFVGFRAAPTGGSTPTVTLDAYLMPQDEFASDKRFTKRYGSDA